MVRSLLLSLVVLLTAQAAPVFAQITTVTVTGQVNGNNSVLAVCSVDKNAQFTGSGFLSGVNPSNGYAYKYPFSITKGSTATGQLVLNGKLAGVYPLTIVASVPNGPLTFSYIVNGKTVVMTGTGVVTAK